MKPFPLQRIHFSSYLEVALGVHEQVFGFQIAIGHPEAVDVLERRKHAPNVVRHTLGK